MTGEIELLFGNLKNVFVAKTTRGKVDAIGKLMVSTLAIAFIAAAFSDWVPSVPESTTVAAGGALGFLLGCFKAAA